MNGLFQEDKIKAAVASILEAVGEDPSRAELKETPGRVSQMYRELLSGLGQDPGEPLVKGFEEGHHGLVISKALTFSSICEHHLLPFFGVAHIGYVADGFVVGISKLARCLDVLAHRLQLQERLTCQLADIIDSALKPKGVGVVLEAEHMCMIVRGIKRPGSKIVTSAYRGLFQQDASARNEFLSLLGEK